VPHGYKWLSEQYKHAVKKSGVTPSSPHTLRHTLNTRLLRTQTPLLVATWMGWSPGDLAPAQRHYTHLGAEDLAVVMDAINKIFLTIRL